MADLGPAFCSDLEKGYSPQQILGASIKNETYTPREAADRAFTFAALHCKDELQGNEKLRVYLENWGINPDA